jgi:hypothetical protein
MPTHTESPRIRRTAVMFAAMCVVGAGSVFAVQAYRAESATAVARTDAATIAQGQQIFRFDTFGDEVVWTDKLQMHRVVESSVDPVTALAVGLKVDADALPPASSAPSISPVPLPR